MIPKIIHYVWFGKQPKSKAIKTCMKSWKKHLKDYKIIEWNETNFDIESHPYALKAYQEKKWAYVSDYVRAYALYNFGGIYLDTDVIVLDSLKDLLLNRAFVGFENEEYPFTAVFGCEPKHIFVKKILDMYDSTQFDYNIQDEFMYTNTKTVSDILINEFGVKITNREQELSHGIKVYPDNVLCNPSHKSRTIHVFTGTWIEEKKPIKNKVVMFFKLRLTTRRRANIYNKIMSI